MSDLTQTQALAIIESNGVYRTRTQIVDADTVIYHYSDGTKSLTPMEPGAGRLHEAIDALGTYGDIDPDVSNFARDLLKCHFTTGIDMSPAANGQGWRSTRFLNAIFVDFDKISVPGGW